MNIPWYELTKALHYVGLVTLVGFFIIMTRARIGLMGTTRVADARIWIDLLEAARPMINAGAILMLVSGGIMVGMRWRGAYPFATAGFLVLVIVTPVASLTVKRYIAEARATLTGDGLLTAEMRSALFAARVWRALMFCNAMLPAVLIAMATKPGWAWTIGLVVVGAIIGVIAGGKMAQAGVAKT